MMVVVMMMMMMMLTMEILMKLKISFELTLVSVPLSVFRKISLILSCEPMSACYLEQTVSAWSSHSCTCHTSEWEFPESVKIIFLRNGTQRSG